MDRLTRKELKQDKFALEFEHSVEYLAEHRRQAIRIGGAAAVIVALVLGVMAYRSHMHRVRQEALTAALRIQGAPVGETGNPFLQGYASRAERDTAATKAFTDLATRYSGSDEGMIAQYYLGVIASDQGKTAEAEKSFREVADSGDRNYASLAKMALADLYAGQGKTSEAEQMLRSLVERPTVFVSREEATIELARVIAPTKPAEARKLLEPLRSGRSAVSRAALTALSGLPAK